jgi:hypothetical protein
MEKVSSETIEPTDAPMPQQLFGFSIEGSTCDVCSHYYFIGEERCEDCPWLIGEVV